MVAEGSLICLWRGSDCVGGIEIELAESRKEPVSGVPSWVELPELKERREISVKREDWEAPESCIELDGIRGTALRSNLTGLICEETLGG